MLMYHRALSQNIRLLFLVGNSGGWGYQIQTFFEIKNLLAAVETSDENTKRHICIKKVE